MGKYVLVKAYTDSEKQTFLSTLGSFASETEAYWTMVDDFRAVLSANCNVAPTKQRDNYWNAFIMYSDHSYTWAIECI